MSHAQAGAAAAGLQTLAAWSLATTDPEDVLLEALRRDNPADVVVGLATVGRLLAIELAVCTDRDEIEVLAGLRGMIDRLAAS